MFSLGYLRGDLVGLVLGLIGLQLLDFVGLLGESGLSWGSVGLGAQCVHYL